MDADRHLPSNDPAPPKKRRLRNYVAAFAAAAALTGVAVPAAFASGAATDTGALARVRLATQAFRHVDEAVNAGYVQFFGCAHQPLSGSMGIHFVNAALVGDGIIDATKPEAVLYEQGADNQLTIVGAEYVVFKAAWDAKHHGPPTLFGQTFSLVPSPNRFGLDPFYELHAWAWKTNPTGDFKDWNPSVLCPGAEGHV